MPLGAPSRLVGFVVRVIALALIAPLASVPVLSQTDSATPIPFPAFDELPPATPRAGEPLKVVATIGLIADWSRQVGGERVRVSAILPPNADPHDYDLTPEDVVALSDADLILTFGLGLDRWAADLIDAADSPAPTLAVGDAVFSVAAESDTGGEQADPHLWFDPTQTAAIVTTIAEALTNIDPQGGPTYSARSSAYNVQLEQLDVAIQDQIDSIPPDRRKMVTNHDALGYYAARYGLTIVGTVIPSMDTHSEASAADIAALIDLIEAENVPAVFAENIVPPDLAEDVANQTGATFVTGLYTDSLGDDESGVTTYIQLMQRDTEIIVNALRDG